MWFYLIKIDVNTSGFQLHTIVTSKKLYTKCKNINKYTFHEGITGFVLCIHHYIKHECYLWIIIITIATKSELYLIYRKLDSLFIKINPNFN